MSDQPEVTPTTTAACTCAALLPIDQEFAPCPVHGWTVEPDRQVCREDVPWPKDALLRDRADAVTDPTPATAAECGHTAHRVNDRGGQGQIARTAWEPCALAGVTTLLARTVRRD